MGIDCFCMVSQKMYRLTSSALKAISLLRAEKLMPHFYFSFESWLDNADLEFYVFFLLKSMLWWLQKDSFQTA